MCFIDKYIIVSSFPLRPSSHGTEQNTGDPWRKEAAVKSYITIATLFTVQQSFSSVRHGKWVYRSDDMIWLINLICTVSVLYTQGSTQQNVSVIILVQSDDLATREEFGITASIMSRQML